MEPWWTSGDGRASLYAGDALAVLAEMETGSVDAVITDPPYSSGGQFRGDRQQDVHSKYVKSDSVSGHALASFGGDNRDQRGYLYWCALWLSEAMRLTRPGGVCAMFTDWRQLPVTTDALQVGGWVWRGIVPWHKPSGRRMQGRWANNCEYIVWGTNGPRPLTAVEGSPPGFFQANAPRERQHVAQKPLEVMRELVKIAPGDAVILDPFAGAGTTGVAAVLEGRRFTGCEMHAAHLATSRERIGTALAGYRPDGAQLVLGAD